MMQQPPAARFLRIPKNNRPTCPSFEQTLGRLEEIVHLLEEGKIGLDEALRTRKAWDCCARPTNCLKRPSGGFRC